MKNTQKNTEILSAPTFIGATPMLGGTSDVSKRPLSMGERMLRNMELGEDLGVKVPTRDASSEVAIDVLADPRVDLFDIPDLVRGDTDIMDIADSERPAGSVVVETDKKDK